MNIETTIDSVNHLGVATTANRPLQTIAIIGTGLIGTSVALALRKRGMITYLYDTDRAAATAAAARGAGILGLPPARVDLTVIAVPPASTPRVLADYQAKRLSHIYTDVASVKSTLLAEAEMLGCDLTTYVAGHPMAGGERSGPMAASAELFDDRVWVLTPVAHTRADALAAVGELVTSIDARPITMAPDEHDCAVARTSHVPHLVSALLAARLDGAEESVLRLCGAGIRDTTRIAAGDVELWTEILRGNATEVSNVLSEIAVDLFTASCALRGDPAELRVLLGRGNAGRAALTASALARGSATPMKAAATYAHLGDVAAQ